MVIVAGPGRLVRIALCGWPCVMTHGTSFKRGLCLRPGTSYVLRAFMEPVFLAKPGTHAASTTPTPTPTYQLRCSVGTLLCTWCLCIIPSCSNKHIDGQTSFHPANRPSLPPSSNPPVYPCLQPVSHLSNHLSPASHQILWIFPSHPSVYPSSYLYVGPSKPFWWFWAVHCYIIAVYEDCIQ